MHATSPDLKAIAEPPPPPLVEDDGEDRSAKEALDTVVENLCSFFYRNRWTLKHAFECVLSPARTTRYPRHTIRALLYTQFIPHLTMAPYRIHTSLPPKAPHHRRSTQDPHHRRITPRPIKDEKLCYVAVSRVLRYFDADGDGVVSPEEFSTAVKALSLMANEDEGNDAFQVSDSVTTPCLVYGPNR